jgi:hypothetical protein
MQMDIAHSPILNYQNFERLLHLQQGVFLNCSQTMVRLYCFPLFPVNHVGALVALLFLFLLWVYNPGYLVLATAEANLTSESTRAIPDTCTYAVFETFSSISRGKSLAWGYCSGASSQVEDSSF